MKELHICSPFVHLAAHAWLHSFHATSVIVAENAMFHKVFVGERYKVLRSEVVCVDTVDIL